MTGIAPGLKHAALAASVVVGISSVFAYAMLRAPSPRETTAAPQTAATLPAPEPGSGPSPEPPPPASPGFDVVRVAPDGGAVVAGRAAPNAQVTILGDAGPLAEATADAAGEFVAIFRAPPGDAPQTLTLQAEDPAGVKTASPDVVVLVPPAPPTANALATTDTATSDAAATATAALDAAPGPAPGEAQATSTAAAPSATSNAPAAPRTEDVAAVAGAPAPPAATPQSVQDAGEPMPRVAAAIVLRGGEAEVTPVAPVAPLARPEALNLASISYGHTGLVSLAGIGVAGSSLRAYVDDRFAREGAVDEDGRWTLELGDVDAGVYRLRIDALRPDGTVASRIETPFQRDFPAVAAPDGNGDGAAPTTAIVVQPGNNLWTIARIHYGAGVLYTQIYTANRDLIRSPELIYPGQIFVLPEGAPAE